MEFDGYSSEGSGAFIGNKVILTTAENIIRFVNSILIK